MYEHIKFKGFHPNKMGTQKIYLDGPTVRGSWVEGSYLKHINRMPCPINDCVKEEDIEHLIIMSDPVADWNMPRQICTYPVLECTLCLQTPYTEVFADNSSKYTEPLYAGDYIIFTVDKIIYPTIHSAEEISMDNEWHTYYGTIEYKDNQFVVSGYDIADNREFEPMYLNYLMRDSNLVSVEKDGCIFDHPQEVKTVKTEPEEIVFGRIIKTEWNIERGLTHYISIQLENGNHKLFGGYSLVGDGASIWMKALFDALGIDKYDEASLTGKSVRLKLVNHQPVALSGRLDILPWLDVRTVFKKEK